MSEKVPTVEDALCYGCDKPNGKHRRDCSAYYTHMRDRITADRLAVAEAVREACAYACRNDTDEAVIRALDLTELIEGEK